MSKYFKFSNKVRVTPDGASEVFDALPAKQYIVRFDPLSGFYLEENAEFNLPDKIFGNVEEQAKKVLKTYKERNCNTGVLLSGEKGAGKTMFARLLSVLGMQENIPTIIVNQSFADEGDSFNKFLADISDRCIIIFDEFEKVFPKDEGQNNILTLFDGTYQSNKLFVLTVNSLYKVSEFILNRPGRVYYHIRYSEIQPEFIHEYCEYYLNDKSHAESVVNLAKAVGKFNFDMLKAIVQECNIHNQSPNQVYKMMNIDLDSTRAEYSYVLINPNSKKKNKEQKGSVTVSIYDVVYLYWEESKDNDESVAFSYNDIRSFDKEKGVFLYEKNGFKLELKREKSNRYVFDF